MGETEFLDSAATDIESELLPSAATSPSFDEESTEGITAVQDVEEASVPQQPVASTSQLSQPVSTPVAATGGRRYKVRSGDTLGAIAQRYYGTGSPGAVAKIQKANGMKTPHAIQIGQTLVIPN